MLWVDKYRPKKLEQLHYHKDLTTMLQKIVSSGDFPHLLFYGPPGAGKHTRIISLLQEVFGNGVHKVKVEQKSFKVTKTKSIEIQLLSSSYHIEINPQEAGIYDRVIVQDVIKDLASSHTINKSEHGFKVVFLKEVDMLTRTAQAGLRRTMEKYMATCRLILCCENMSKVIDPLRSRCLAVRVPAPAEKEVLEVLNYVADQEGIKLPPKLAERIAKASDRNLRKALLMFETCFVDQQRLKPDQRVKSSAWEMFIDEIACLIIQEQSPRRLMKIRGKVYELLCNCIPPSEIIKRLAQGLISKVDDVLRPKIVELAHKHEYRLCRANKPVIHIEAFVAAVMKAYMDWYVELFG